MGNPISWKFGMQKGGIRAHIGTKFGSNMINTHKVVCDYSRKQYVFEVNCTWQEVKIGTEIG